MFIDMTVQRDIGRPAQRFEIAGEQRIRGLGHTVEKMDFFLRTTSCDQLFQPRQEGRDADASRLLLVSIVLAFGAMLLANVIQRRKQAA